jgi:hypothetical protein
MTLTQLKNIIDRLYQTESNREKEILADVKIGYTVKKVKLYGRNFIALYMREKNED